MTPTRSLAVTQPLRVFGITWVGQLVSVLGSGLTSFAIGVRVYQDTGSVTQLALVSFFYVLPMMVLSPLAGALVDRWDRGRAMLISDLGAGLGAVLIWLLLLSGEAGIWPLKPWHFFLPIAQISAFSALRWPAYYATIPLLVPKPQLGRANGLVELATGVGQVVAPMLAAALVTRIGLERVILIDVSSFALAVLSLLIVRFPRPPLTAAGKASKGSLRHEIAHGWGFIRERPGLSGLLVVLFCFNLVLGLITVLITPMVLSVSGVSGLGVTLSVAGLGMLLGGIAMSAWGGPRRRISGVLGFFLFSGVVLFMGALPPSAPLIAIGAALFLFNTPVIASCSQAIWQSKVAPDLQGRVFAVRRMVSLSAAPLANLIAGPLADRWFEPWLAPGGALASSVGRVIGTGPGRGIGFLFIVTGVLVVAGAIVAYFSPRLRNIEQELPDAISLDVTRSTADRVGPSAEVPAENAPAPAPESGGSR